MFHKENSSVYSRGKKAKDVPLRKSDRKALRKEAVQIFAQLHGNESLSEILDNSFLQGSGSSLAARKLVVDDQKMTLYLRSPADDDNNNTDDEWPYRLHPQVVWMEMDVGPRQTLHLPGLALLSLLPKDSIPTVYVPPQVSKFLCRGANLMRAGMFQIPPQRLEGSPLVALAVEGNPQPMAIGWLDNGVKSSADIGVGTTGVGVHVVSCYGDDIWRQQLPAKQTTVQESAPVNPLGGAQYDQGHYGNVGFIDGKFVSPITTTRTTEEATETTFSDPTGTISNDPPALEQEADVHETEACEDEKESQLTPEEILHVSVCRALASLSKSDLPMTVATFYAQHVLHARPEGTTINLKQTRYKKFGNYLQEQVEAGLLVVGPDASQKDAAGMLCQINKQHHDIREHKKSVSASAADSATRLILLDLYVVPRGAINGLRLDEDICKAANATSEERRNSSMLTLKEIRAILNDYLERESLIKWNEVSLDGPLTDFLYKKNASSAPATLTRKEISSLWESRMEKGFALVSMPGNEILKMARGESPRVSIEVERRQSKKFVTFLRGLEDYHIDPRTFAKDVSGRFACSATIEAAPEKRPGLKKGRVELVFGGNLVDELEALLTADDSLTSHGGAKNSTYSVPRNAIQMTLRKGVPARKRKPGKKK